MRSLVLSVLMGLAVLVALATGPAMAGDLSPAIPKAQGTCVDDPKVMRSHHFDFLKHQRDATLRQGVRGAKHSLKECVSCHAQKDASGKAIPVNDPGQFCQSCHAYAAVAPDCFTCHATVPDKGAQTAGMTR